MDKLNIDRLYEIIGEKLRQRRHDVGWSQAQVAKHLGVQRASVANFESGRQRFPLHLVYQYAEIIGISPLLVFPKPEELVAVPTVEITLKEGRFPLSAGGAKFVESMLTKSIPSFDGEKNEKK